VKGPGLAKGKPRLLLADADDRMRAWVRDALDGFGAHIAEVASGFELLDRLAEEGPYDLVITEGRMSHPTGLQVVAMAREAGLGTPFLVITGAPDHRMSEVVHAIGRADFLSKPFDGATLLSRIRGLLGMTAPETLRDVG
jgi:DNA-binding response OmpR family regulator